MRGMYLSFSSSNCEGNLNRTDARMGNLNEALSSYRNAEKLDRNVYSVIQQNPHLLKDAKAGVVDGQDFYT